LWPSRGTLYRAHIGSHHKAEVDVGATAVVAHDTNTNARAQTVMVLLIWTAMPVINIAYAPRRREPAMNDDAKDRL